MIRVEWTSRIVFLATISSIVWLTIYFTGIETSKNNYIELSSEYPFTISSASWKPDGEAFIVNSDRGVWIYSTDFEDISHLKEARLSAFSHDGALIAGIHKDRAALLIWETEHYDLVNTIELSTELRSLDAITLVWSPDGEQIAIGLYDEVIVYDVGSKQSVLALALLSPISSLVWNPTGETFAVGRVGALDIIDTEGEILNTLSIDAGRIIPSWSPDGQTLATLGTYFSGGLSVTNAIRLWDAESYSLKLVIQAPLTRTMAWTPDGEAIVAEYYSYEFDSPLHYLGFWSAQTAEILPLGLIDGHPTEPILSIAWSPDHTILMIASADNMVRFYDWPLTQNATRILSFIDDS